MVPPNSGCWVIVDVGLVLGCITAQVAKSSPVTAYSIPDTFLVGITVGLRGMSASHLSEKPSDRDISGAQLEAVELCDSTESGQAVGGLWWLGWLG